MTRRKVNGAAVREMRIMLGISQPELARRCGVTQPAMSYIERGQRNPSPSVTKSIADALGVSLDSITHVVAELAS